MAALRPGQAGKTRNCPHCKAIILESASVCPGCHHHLRFGPMAGQRSVSVKPALRVEGAIKHPGHQEPWEYSVVISIRNERDEEVARQVVGVGALQPLERRTFSLAVDVLAPGKEEAPAEVATTKSPAASQAQPSAARPPASSPASTSPPSSSPTPAPGQPARSLQPPKALSPIQPAQSPTKRFY
jgi:hypothetical protein